MESWVDDSHARGAEGDRVRRSGALRLAWDLPDDAQVHRLLSTLEARLDDPLLMRHELEAIIMILLILQSGRIRESWLDATLSIVTTFNHVRMLSPGIALKGGEAIIILRDQSAGKSANILIPAIAVLARAAALVAAKMSASGRLFRSSDEILQRESARLLKRQMALAKAAGGDAALRRWLLRRLRDVGRGDPAFASIIDPDRRDVAKTIAAYYAVDDQAAWDRFSSAVGSVRHLSIGTFPVAGASTRHGNERCPADAEVKNALVSLQRLLKRNAIHPRLRLKPQPDAPPPLGTLPIARSRHIAMMIYTFALVSFGTGQRGHQPMAASDMIDPETGFAWVVEKGKVGKGRDGERGVFHSSMVRQQIAQYEHYVKKLIAMLKQQPHTAAEVKNIVNRPGIRFFDIQNGRVVEISHKKLHEEATALLSWPFSAGAGRKWLRSKLGGVTPSDAIAAQFGHHHDGFSVWSSVSALRPDEVSTALKKVIDPIMSGAGFSPSNNIALRIPQKVVDLPDFTRLPSIRRAQAGRILASAMWHGALLNQDQQFAVLKAATAAIGSRETPEWLDLDDTSYASRQRWFIDPHTRVLLDDQRRRGERRLEGAVDEVLYEFFASLPCDETSLRSPHAIRANVARFRAAVEQRWRFKLPPILFAAAQAKLSNFSLQAATFNPDVDRPPPPPDNRPRRHAFERRASYRELKCFLERCWATSGTLDNRKQVAHKRGAAIIRQSFYRQMSMLEQSLANALITSLQAQRPHPLPSGDCMDAILRRAGRLWQHFVPQDIAVWEDQLFDALSVEKIFQHLPPRVPWRGDVANDLVSLLVDVGAHEKNSDTIIQLLQVDRSHTTSVFRANEYVALTKNAPEHIALAAMLSYRTGLRINELRWIGSSHVSDRHRVTTLSVNHSRYRRLKTHESRRHIPVQLLLTQDELDRFKRANGSAEMVTSITKIEGAYDADLVEALTAVTKVKFNFFPLRHSFATNIYAALLWPDEDHNGLQRFFDPLLITRRRKLRRHLCSDDSLGAAAPHAIALLMGHTHPWRALFNYVHNLEVVLAAHVRSVTRVPKADTISRPDQLAA